MTGIFDAFRQWVRRTPDAVAIDAPGSRLSYAELDRLASGLAARLDVAPGDVVAVSMERSAGLIAALLGILKAGATYLPLDPAEPTIRLRTMLDDTRPAVVVRDSPGGVSFEVQRSVCAEGPMNPRRHADLAYVMYTSGSTGTPKAVMVDHGNVLNLVTSPNYVRIGPGDRVLQFAPAAFDAATFEIWGPLLNGACVVVAPPGPLSPADLASYVDDTGVTVAWLTAALFHQQIDEAPEAFRKMHTVLAGGQVLSVPHVRALREQIPGLRIVNGYGPTECTTFTCCHVLAPDEPLTGSVPIGRPIQNVVAHVLDESGRPATSGELYIGGAGVARGYWRRPALTASRFVPAASGERLYRSGDLVRRRADGVLEFLGRTDDQVKIRGHRIEPGEIENVLTSHPSVRQAAVVYDSHLIAYVVLADPGPLNTRALRRYTLERLPRHMIPATFVPVPALPLTRNGKTDHSALVADTHAITNAAAPAARRSSSVGQDRL